MGRPSESSKSGCISTYTLMRRSPRAFGTTWVLNWSFCSSLARQNSRMDTGWFEEEWRCDYRFSKKRFKNPRKMIQDLKKQGFRVSLWQLPYFTPQNRLFPEIVKKGFCAKGAKGGLPTEDATLDFSNPKAVKWYQGHLANLLRQGVAAIKVDFGEAAPVNAVYASGKTGFMEHNYYPLRYNKAAVDADRSRDGRFHHLGEKRLGGKPAISLALGWGRRETRTTPWPPP